MRSHTNERLVIGKLKDILTVADEDRQELIDYVTSDLEFCDELAVIFEAVARPLQRNADLAHQLSQEVRDQEDPNEELGITRKEKIGNEKQPEGFREWLHHSLASLPSSCIRVENHLLILKPTPAASLRYLSMDYMDDFEIVMDKGFRSRELLCDLLYNALSENGKDIYKEIAQRSNSIGLSSCYSIHSDVAIVNAVQKLEFLFYEVYARLESAYRESHGIPMAIPTCIDWIKPLTNRSAVALICWVREVVKSIRPKERSRDDKIAEILSHVAANRVLLEIACRGEFRSDSATKTAKFIDALNDAGINEIPSVSSNSEIFDCLHCWFGRNGVALRYNDYHDLSELEIHAAIEGAEQAQSMFMLTRAVFWNPQDKVENKRDLLIFALALIISKYHDLLVRGEVTGSGRVQVFPNLKQINKGGALSPSALEMIMIIYGQIIYANEGWNLSAKKIESYVSANQLKRSYLETLIFNVFKRYHPLCLVKISSEILAKPRIIVREESGEFFASLVSL